LDCHIVSSAFTPGNPEDHSLFCSEAAGIYGLFLMLWTLNYNTATAGHIWIAYNSKSVLERINLMKDTDLSAAHVDLLQAIWTIWQQFSFTVQLDDVQGH